MTEPITIQATIKAPMEKVWLYYNEPSHVSNWAFAQDDWQAEGKSNDLRVGGSFLTIMSAKDNSTSFEFGGTYTAIQEYALIEYDMDDTRHVKIEFETVADGVLVKTSFDPETSNSRELQQQGWQAILNNFKKYVESN